MPSISVDKSEIMPSNNDDTSMKVRHYQVFYKSINAALHCCESFSKGWYVTDLLVDDELYEKHDKWSDTCGIDFDDESLTVDCSIRFVHL